MAIVKFIAIHDHHGVDRCIKYVDDREKNMLDIGHNGSFHSSDIADIDNLVDYSVNPEKTRLSRLTGGTVLVSGINCPADFAKEEFKISRVTYENSVKEKHIYGEKAKDENGKKKKESIEAYHVIQSFPKEVTDPELVHHIGKLYAQRMFPHQKCLVSTHMNTKHLHNHIIVCAYETERPRKFKMNKAAITKMKMINDELSLAYGLPILSNDISDRLLNRQMEDELRRFGSGPVTDINMSVGEYQARANNKAWKAGLEDTIHDIAGRSDSWEDFARNMDTAGWTIKETPKNITFINKERPGIRVRGATLGEEFTKEAISREQKWDAVPSLEAENSVLNSKSDSAKLRQAIYDEISALSSPGPAPLHFHIPRYTKWGRRRSDLELIFIAAIRIISYIKDQFLEKLSGPQMGSPQSLEYYQKLQTVAKAIHTARSLKIETIDQLNERLRNAGASLSQEQAALKNIQSDLEAVGRLIEQYRRLTELEQKIHQNDPGLDLGIDKLYLHHPDEQTIQENRAKVQPLTPILRASLFHALKNHTECRLKFEWKDMDKRLSLADGQRLLRFLRGHTTEMPTDLLETRYQYEQNALSRKYERIRENKDQSLFEKYNKVPVSEKMLKKLNTLCDQQGLRIDSGSLSAYEGLQIISGYADNPFNQPLISGSQIRGLRQLLKQNGLSLNRDIHYVTQAELMAIRRYADNPALRMPDLLTSSKPARPSSIRQIRELLELKGERINIPAEALSQKDADRLFDWLLHRGEPSIILKRLESKALTAEFQHSIRNLSPEVQALLNEYRSILQNLMNCGYSLEDRASIRESELSLRKAEQYHAQAVSSLKTEYRELKNLGRCVRLSDDIPAYILSEDPASSTDPNVSIVKHLQESNRELAIQERLRQENNRKMPEKKELNISDQPIPDSIDEAHTSPDEELESTIPIRH